MQRGEAARPKAEKKNAGVLPSLRQVAGDPAAYVRLLRRRLEMQLEDRRARKGTLIVLGGAVLMVGALIYWGLIIWSVPTVEELREARYAEATVVYAADGEVLTRYQTKNHMRVTIDQIAPEVLEALVATEDHRFYRHAGIDLGRLFGSVVHTLQGDRQGGSTITMQLARNAFPDFQNHFVGRRKIEEWLTARRVEQMYSKDEILEMYLNAVPFMYDAFGIEAGAQTYFQKSAAELDLLESATLVGMLKGTVYYNPVRNPERSHERRNVVLRQMVRHGYLSESEFEALREEPTALDFRRLDRRDGPAPFFTEYLRQWLDGWAEENGYNLYTSGLQIYTPIDSHLQEAAEAAVHQVGEDLQAVADVEWSQPAVPFVSGSTDRYKRYRDRIQPFAYYWETNPALLEGHLRRSLRFQELAASGVPEDSALARVRADTALVDSVKAAVQRMEAGFVAIEPHTGAVKAWVGGRDFRQGQYDHVAQARRQPGSTFKPFVYTAALEVGLAPDHQLRDEVRTFRDAAGRTWRPENVGGASGQLMTISQGLAQSKNTITAQLMEAVGPERVVETARRMGIDSELQPVLSLGLGTSDVTLLEMTAAYSTIANRGQYRAPLVVTRIEDRNGYLLESFAAESRPALDQHIAYTVLDMMRGVLDHGTGRRIRSVFGISGDLAGKTGTTQHGADGWFLLMHPELVMGAWVGFDNPAITFRSSYWGQGAHNALSIVGATARQAPLAREAAFEPPPGYTPRSTSGPLPETLTTRVDSLLRDTLNTAESRARADSILQQIDGQSAADSLTRRQRIRDDQDQQGDSLSARTEW